MGLRKVLFLSSWYPNRTYPTHGIFVKHHSLAAAHTNDVAVVYVNSDKDLNKRFEVVQDNSGAVKTTIVYYKKVTGGLPVIKHLQKLFLFLSAYKIGLKVLFSSWGKPDIVHLNILMPAGIIAWLLKKRYGIKYIVSENWTGYLPSDGNYKGFWLKFFTKKVALNSSCICPVSMDLQKALKGHEFKNKYQIVPNVVDTDFFKPSEKDNSRTSQKFRFIHVSVLDDAQKNITGMLRGVAEAYLHNKQFEMVIVGDGPERVQLQQYASDLGLDGVVFFLGLKLKSDLVVEFQKSHAFILFSNYENLPCVVLEAMSCGLPVIVTNTGGTPEHVTPEFGMVIEPKNESALTNSILEMYDKSDLYNRNLIRDYAVNNFSMEAVNKLFDKTYNEVLS